MGYLKNYFTFWCIFHAESKYDNENLNFEHFWKKVDNFDLSSVFEIHVERVKHICDAIMQNKSEVTQIKF